MRFGLFTAAFGLALCGSALCGCHSDGDHYGTAQTSEQTTTSWKISSVKSMSAHDREFVDAAAQGGMFELDSARMALDKNASGPNRAFANMMLEDHEKANKELEKVVREKGGMLPIAPDAEHRRMLDDLSKTQGQTFDEAYHKAQVKVHDDAIALFEDAARNCDDADLRTFAEKTLPTLVKHRDHLNEIVSAVMDRR
jgi:putative membrane protein